MREHIIKLPDVGEGVAEAELVEWHVEVGELVREDTILGAVMTDKATVEIPSPVDGKVAWLGAEVGDSVAVGAPLVKLEVEGEGAVSEASVTAAPTGEKPEADDAANEGEREPPPPGAEPMPSAPAATTAAPKAAAAAAGALGPEGERPLASPAVRLRAKEAGVDLWQVPGTGPAGRISHEDLDTFIARGRQPRAAGRRRHTRMGEVKGGGVRRPLAE